MSIVHKCVDWNAARYDQVFNADLSVNLLMEETDELYAAKTNVDKLDAVGDIVFVAIGVMWKLGVSKEKIDSLVYGVPLNELDAFNAHVWMQHMLAELVENLNNGNEFASAQLACHSICITALGALRGMKLQHRFYDIVDAICVSNNTKEVKGKVDAAIKANIVKGAGYVPPTAALTEINNSIN